MRSENVDAETGKGGRVEDVAADIEALDLQKAPNGDQVDDDGRPKRTGTMWTASAHIITAVIGSGVLSLAWCTAQLGYIAGPASILTFSLVTFYTSTLLTDCYRSPDPVTGKRNHSYMEAVRANLGGTMHMFCGLAQYFNIVGISIGYNITSTMSLVAIQRSHCFHKRGRDASCATSHNIFMIAYGIVQMILSQIPNIHELSWLSTIAAVMSFSYSIIGVVLSASRIISGDTGKATLGGVEVGPNLTESQKIWQTFTALGNIAFAYTYSVILIEIQDTIRAPAENKEMRKASLVGVTTTTLFYILCGSVGYAAFGNDAPGNLLTGFYKPLWLIDFANICIVVHLVGAFQVFCQPLFSAVETWASKSSNMSNITTKDYPVKIGKKFKYNINLFRLVWRTIFVALATVLAMAMPFFNDILGLLGALGYWPLTVYFPVQMYITQKRIGRFTYRWIGLKVLNICCFIVALCAASGAIHGMSKALREAKPFKGNL
ncbi:hypothetical protein Syun_011430 [Stephania yunnanensis]|uniref:Amino acid transporter transmembrane domain-containing protein n=1 Tax=Stephania yunnanensis TaxID=152371 RepID=A0AAP0PI51_9MAGN